MDGGLALYNWIPDAEDWWAPVALTADRPSGSP